MKLKLEMRNCTLTELHQQLRFQHKLKKDIVSPTNNLFMQDEYEPDRGPRCS